jgi:hypothetical protein
LHFYTKQRAAEALQSLRISGHQFEGVDLVSHRKEIGISQEPLQTDEDSDEQEMRKRADRYAEDDEGFTVIKKRLI